MAPALRMAGTSSLAHLEENCGAGAVGLDDATYAELDSLAELLVLVGGPGVALGDRGPGRPGHRRLPRRRRRGPFLPLWSSRPSRSLMAGAMPR